MAAKQASSLRLFFFLFFWKKTVFNFEMIAFDIELRGDYTGGEPRTAIIFIMAD